MFLKMKATWVRTLVRELRSHMPHDSQKKGKKKKIYQSEGQRDNMREKYLPLIANGLSSLIYKQLSQINKQKTKHPKEKQTKDMNRQFRNRNSHGP